jgi:hypothetical protein
MKHITAIELINNEIYYYKECLKDPDNTKEGIKFYKQRIKDLKASRDVLAKIE